MRKLLFFVSIFYVLNLNAQNYLISFEGTEPFVTMTTLFTEAMAPNSVGFQFAA
jgi:hypothetical protein